MDFSAQAQTSSALLMGWTEGGAPHLLKALVGEERFDESRHLLVVVQGELLMFGLHLTDRIAFGKLGASARAYFMDALLPSIQSELRPPLSTQLETVYNARQTFYSGFHKLYPDEKESLKGTLFWELGKMLSAMYADGNPAAIVGASMLGMEFMKGLSKAFEDAGVF